MSETKTVGLTDGRQVVITDFTPDAFHPGVSNISFQFESASGFPTGGSQLLVESHPLNPNVTDGETVGPFFDAVALTGGGFEVAYTILTQNSEGVFERAVIDAAVGPDGSILAGDAREIDASTQALSATLAPPLLAELPGDRYVQAFESFDANHNATSHVDLATALGGIYADVVVSSRPDAITHDSGDLTLTWNASGVTEREVVGLNGVVLADRGASKVFTLGVAGATDLERADFNPAHDQIRLVNADGSAAGGTASTLTYDERSHSLTWDPDSQGPAPATQVADFVDPKAASPDGLPFNVANLADGFRPAVLRVIFGDGSSDLTWFDTTNSQPWDTLHATEDAKGDVLTYGSTADNGTQEVFTFDVTNTQAYQRYVDEIDVAGHVSQRTVLYDDGSSWTAKFALVGGQVVSYELDSFDAAGRQVGQSFFNADGTPLGH